MYLARHGDNVQHRPRRSRLDDDGYILVVLLIAMAVSAIWMASALPSWRQQAVREKEAEFIFRGEQYARAIALYYAKNNQTLPPSIDILVSQHYLRQKYKDPITGKDFVPVGSVNTQQNPGQAGGATVIRGGISGVRGTSNDPSIKVYYNQQVYSQFPFDYTAVAARMGMTLNPNAPAQTNPPSGGRTGGGQNPPNGPAGAGRGRGAPGGAPGDETAPIRPPGRVGGAPQGGAPGSTFQVPGGGRGR